MDSDGSIFQTALTCPNLPIRCHTAMPPQPLVPWTAVSLLSTFVAWLVAETPLTTPLAPPLARAPMTAPATMRNDRRA